MITATTVRRMARGKVQHAVTAGRLIRLPCQDCGEPQVQAHHANGYDEDHALDVVWLCQDHHLARHGRRARPTWARVGRRAYIESTGRQPYHGRTYSFSEWSAPRHLFKSIERLWAQFRTDEEREWAWSVVQRLHRSTEAPA